MIPSAGGAWRRDPESLLQVPVVLIGRRAQLGETGLGFCPVLVLSKGIQAPLPPQTPASYTWERINPPSPSISGLVSALLQ